MTNDIVALLQNRIKSIVLLGVLIAVNTILNFKKPGVSFVDLFAKINRYLERHEMCVFDNDNHLYVTPLLEMACVPYAKIEC